MSLIETSMLEALQVGLFLQDGENTYAVIDGASCEGLLEKFDELEPRYYCLYTGELEPDVEEAAPHLVELLPNHPFTEWFLVDGFGKHWGIFARSPVGLRAMRKHFRTFLLVKDPAGKTLYFRYYDPRVLTMYLPTTNAVERKTFFNEVSTYFVETADGALVTYHRHGAELEQQTCFIRSR